MSPAVIWLHHKFTGKENLFVGGIGSSGNEGDALDVL
jgi:hypothetical protein